MNFHSRPFNVFWTRVLKFTWFSVRFICHLCVHIQITYVRNYLSTVNTAIFIYFCVYSIIFYFETLNIFFYNNIFVKFVCKKNCFDLIFFFCGNFIINFLLHLFTIYIYIYIFINFYLLLFFLNIQYFLYTKL